MSTSRPATRSEEPSAPLFGEPVALPNGIIGLVQAGLGLAVLFGVDLSIEQIAGVTAFVGAALLVVTLFQRSLVTPVGDPKDNEGTPLVPVTEQMPSHSPAFEHEDPPLRGVEPDADYGSPPDIR